MHDSWNSLAALARNNWQLAWTKAERDARGRSPFVQFDKFIGLILGMPSLVRDHCAELDGSVVEWLGQTRALDALANANRTAEELTGTIRDCAMKSLEASSEDSEERGLQDDEVFQWAYGEARTGIEDQIRATSEKVAERIRRREFAVLKEEKDEKTRNSRDRIRTYFPVGTAILGGIVTFGLWAWGNSGASISGVVTLITVAIGSIAWSWRHRSTD